jgi:hypothetical protein
MAEDNDIHNSAKALIIKAAEKSGLLEEVAGMLWWANKLEQDPQSPALCCSCGTCPACELLSDLTDAFDAHICCPGDAVERALSCEAIDPSPVTPEDKAEAAAFIGDKENRAD